jgi:hypothetical protein
MLNGSAIALAFLLMVVLQNVAGRVLRKGSTREIRLLSTLGLIVAGYCLFAGIAMIADWSNPLSHASGQLLGHTAAMGRGGGSLLLIIIGFWPHVLIVLSGFTGFVWTLVLMKSYGVTIKIFSFTRPKQNQFPKPNGVDLGGERS